MDWQAHNAIKGHVLQPHLKPCAIETDGQRIEGKCSSFEQHAVLMNDNAMYVNEANPSVRIVGGPTLMRWKAEEELTDLAPCAHEKT